MSPVKVTVTVQPGGTLTVDRLPFEAGQTVEVTVTPTAGEAAPAANDPTEGDKYPLRGTSGYYIDPFEPAWDPDEWECDQ